MNNSTLFEKITIFESDASLYSQLNRCVWEECEIDYDSAILNMQKSENMQPWFCKINPKMEIPALQHRKLNGEIINMGGSSSIARYGLSLSSYKKRIEMFPIDKQAEINEVIEVIYSVDIPAVSYNLAAKKYASIKYLLANRKEIVPIL